MTDLVRLAHGCWIPAVDAENLRTRCAAFLAAAPPHTVIAGLSAAELHGFWLPERVGPSSPVELVTWSPGQRAREMTRPRRDEVRAHRRQLAPEDVTASESIPITWMARTWRDLATGLQLADLVAAGDSALLLGCSPESLSDVCRRLRCGRGARNAATALAMLDRRSRSRPESHLRVAITVPELPVFAVNEPVFNDFGEWLAEPDLSCPEAKIALEYQGADHAELSRMRKDITRHGDLRRAGYETLFYGPAEVFGRPWSIAAELRHLIAIRAPQMLPRRNSYRPSRQPQPRVGNNAASGHE
jgi:very-short-patch-repair endonuclease